MVVALRTLRSTGLSMRSDKRFGQVSLVFHATVHKLKGQDAHVNMGKLGSSTLSTTFSSTHSTWNFPGNPRRPIAKGFLSKE